MQPDNRQENIWKYKEYYLEAQIRDIFLFTGKFCLVFSTVIKIHRIDADSVYEFSC